MSDCQNGLLHPCQRWLRNLSLKESHPQSICKRAIARHGKADISWLKP